MQTYVVGGAVRDQLLGLPVVDRDHVVVGATPEDLVRAGYRPVGADFPVFLHPQTQEEYALARTERKTAPGYKGFVFHAAPDVTLEEDLRRRDLTINAMAQAEDGTLIDPYGGKADLDARVLRHVSESFGEDPVRILRLARFAARFATLGFTIAPETLALMRRMVEAGEVDALVPERVWQELARGLLEQSPSRLVSVLHDCGALQRLLPEVEEVFRSAAHRDVLLRLLDAAAQNSLSLPVRYAVLLHDPAAAGPAERRADRARQMSTRLKAPTDCRDLAVMTARLHRQVWAALTLDAAALLDLLDGADALRRPERFEELLLACGVLHEAVTGLADSPFPQQNLLRHVLAALRQLELGSIAAQGGDIAANIRRAKLAAIEHHLRSHQGEVT